MDIVHEFYTVLSVHYSSIFKFQPTNAHNYHLIHNNICKSNKILHVSVLPGPSSGITLIGAV